MDGWTNRWVDRFSIQMYSSVLTIERTHRQSKQIFVSKYIVPTKGTRARK
jgi:hypothetical protein